MASNTDETFAKYKTYGTAAVGAVALASVLDWFTAPSEEEIAEAKAASEAVVEARRVAVENPGAEAEEKIKPIEKLAVVAKAPEPGPARGGAEVYQAACMACHAAGVMEAPKLEAGAWDARAHKGLDGLTTSAINGINNMPARGGNPAITDEEMKNAVAYMLTESGYDPDALGEAVEEEKTAAIDPAVMEEIKAAAAEAKAAAEAAKASAAEAKASADAAQTAVTGAAAAVTAAAVAAVGGEDETETEMAQDSGADSVGRQVYESTCFTCHDVGIFGSPMISDTAAWNERVGKGMDALYATAINGNGTNTKPARGGHPDLSDAQVQAAVDYMLATAGADMTAAGTVTQQAAQTEETVEEAPAANETETETEAASEESTETAQESAESTEEAVQEETQPDAEATEEKAEEAVQEAQPEAEATPEAEAATEEKAEEATQEPAAEVKQEATETVAAAAPSWAGIDGEKVYRGLCFSCHDMGVAQAPVLGKATAWEARIAAGMDALYENSIKGKGIMPAKGGNPNLSDDEIKAAVDWMVSQVE